MISIKRMKLTGAAILFSRGMRLLQAAPEGYPYHSLASGTRDATTSILHQRHIGRVLRSSCDYPG
jgi:hypothetical protein